MTPEAQNRIVKAHLALPEACRHRPASETELAEFESVFGAIPEEYRWYLAACGGGVVGSERVDDIVRLKISHQKFRREAVPPKGWKKKDMFVIGWDGSGNPMGIDPGTKRVVVEDHNFGGVHVVADSFSDFAFQKK